MVKPVVACEVFFAEREKEKERTADVVNASAGAVYL
jgi:hypothetical protein